MTTIQDTARSASIARVTAGAAWLDQVRPGWEHEINLAVLDISCPETCILGQAVWGGGRRDVTQVDADGWGPYTSENQSGYGFVSHIAYQALGNDHDHGAGEWLTDHGFHLDEDGDAWVALIKERFDTGNLSGFQA